MSAFNGIKIFAATVIAHRHVLGEEVTRWLADARSHRPGFRLVDVVVRQSSDAAFHCLTICLFFNEDRAPDVVLPLERAST